jgi:hypothetical protein
MQLHISPTGNRGGNRPPTRTGHNTKSIYKVLPARSSRAETCRLQQSEVVPTVYLITDTHSISTTHYSVTGPTPITEITAHQQWTISCQKRNTNGEIRVETDRKPHAVCPTCNFTDTDAKCLLTLRCEGWYHKRCNKNANSIACRACQEYDPIATLATTAPLTTTEHNHLNNARGLIYTSTDGSPSRRSNNKHLLHMVTMHPGGITMR